MKLTDITNQVPTALALAERVGIHTKASIRRRRVARVGYFGAGLAVGSGLAALLVPTNGAENRKRLRERAHQARDYVAGNAESESRTKLKSGA